MVILKCSSLIKWLLGKYTLHDATQTIPKVLTIKIKISEYDLQKGAMHKALDITVPPPTKAAVAPKVAAPVSNRGLSQACSFKENGGNRWIYMTQLQIVPES